MTSLSGVWDLSGHTRSIGNPVARAALAGIELRRDIHRRGRSSLFGSGRLRHKQHGNSAADRVPKVARNIFISARFVSFDPGITRKIRFYERARLQLIVEAFNAFNRVNFDRIQNVMFTSLALIPPS